MKPKDINTNNIGGVSSYRNPTDEEFWSAIRKILSYEEPSHKWSQVSRLARKHVEKKFFETLPNATQNKIIAQIFGNENPLNKSVDKTFENLDRTISALIAFEDLKRFQLLAFDMWHQSKELKGAKINNLAFLQELFADIFVQFKQSEIAWLDFWVENAVAWQRILEPGPWRNDHNLGVPIAGLLQGFKSALEAAWHRHPFSVWNENLKYWTTKFSGGFLSEKILLVEGQTEIILLPSFSKQLDIDLNKISVHLDACGGAQQMAKQYLNLRDTVSIPVMCLLDADASEQSEIITDSLRDCDLLLTLEKGEIEDIFGDEIIFRSMQTYLSQMGFLDSIQFSDLQFPSKPADENEPQTRVERLDRLCRERNLGAFDKVSFAKILANKIEPDEIPTEAREILNQLKKLDPEKKGLRFNG